MVGLLLKAGAKTNILDSVHDDHYVHVGIIILLQKIRGIKFRQREHVAKCSPSEDFQLYSIMYCYVDCRTV